MEKLQVIHTQEILNRNFTVYGTLENPLFLAKDVAEWIEHSDVSTMLRGVDEDEKLIQTLFVSGQNRQAWFLTEYGLYELLMQSRKPTAKQFKKQVKIILKEIRMNGGYIAISEDDDDDAIMAKALLIANKKIESKNKRIIEQQQIIEQQKPKVVYAEAVEVSTNSILVKDLATLLKQKGLDIGQNRLFDWLRDNDYLCKKKGSMFNKPTQKSMDQGLFELKQGIRTGSKGELKTTYTPKVTGKGQLYFINKFLMHEQVVN